MAISALCAVHCLLSATLMGLVAGFGGLFDHEVHVAGLAIALVLGIVGIGQGMVRNGAVTPLATGMLGLGLMAAALVTPHGAPAGGISNELALTVAGVSLLALAHYLNRRACH